MSRKLHELLAAEADLEKTAKVIISEAKNTFDKKANLFKGSRRVLKALSDQYQEMEDKFVPEEVEMEDTVPGKLAYVLEHVGAYWDATFQKESTNQEADADVMIDGEVIFEAAPVTFLLGMEKKLKFIRDMFLSIPTLDPGVRWVKDEKMGKDVWKLEEPQIKYKTKNEIVHKVLYDATDKHPAQIEKWTEQKEVAKYEYMVWSGMISSAKKAELIQRVDKLLIAVKEARMRANQEEVKGGNVAEKIFKYLLK